jgi:hypothetical protein
MYWRYGAMTRCNEGRSPQLSRAFILGVSTPSTTMGSLWKRATARRSWAWTCTAAGSVLVGMTEDGASWTLTAHAAQQAAG